MVKMLVQNFKSIASLEYRQVKRDNEDNRDKMTRCDTVGGLKVENNDLDI